MNNDGPRVTLVSRSDDLKAYLAANPEGAEQFLNSIVAAYRALQGLSTNPRDWNLVKEKETSGNARASRKRQ